MPEQFCAAPNKSLPRRTTLPKDRLRWNFTSERPSRPGPNWAAASLGLADRGKGDAARLPRRTRLRRGALKKACGASCVLPRAKERSRSCPQLVLQTRGRPVLPVAQGPSVWLSHASFLLQRHARAVIRLQQKLETRESPEILEEVDVLPKR